MRPRNPNHNKLVERKDYPDFPESVHIKPKLLVVTNVWNEESRIGRLVANIAKQTLQPSLWVWIDDGSTDRTYNKLFNLKESGDLSFPVEIYSMPTKQKGNLDTIGRAYTSVMWEIVDRYSFDYLTLADVDNEYPPDYYEKMCKYMDAHPEIGVLSAQARGDKIRLEENPMGGGKIVRWDIVMAIDKYWDLAPDVFFNAKAEAMGYKTVGLQDYFIDSSPTISMAGAAGKFRYGRRLSYVSRPLILVLYQALWFLIERKDASDFLRGFWSEWSRGTWKCTDKDIITHYSLRNRYKSFSPVRLLKAIRRRVK